jgi:fibronectin-binding autotransporter adhesin
MKTAIVHFAKTLLAITLLVPTVTLAQTTVTVYSYQSGNFADPNIWTYTNGGVDFVTDPLDPNWNYVINPGHTITLTANSQIVQTTGTVTINGTLNVQTFTTQTFGRLLGNGTLRINTAGNPFPNVSNVTGSNFLQTGGGTVQYEGGAYTLPNNLTTYNNLTIAGTGAKSFAPTSATTFTLNGNLTVNTGATLTIGGTGAAPVVTLNISGNLTVNSGATLNVGTTTNVVQHAINLSGNLTNSGTIDLTNLAEGANPFDPTSTGGSARIRFTGATDNTVTLNVGHSTQFGNFIVNKGTGQTNVLHVIVQAGAANPEFWGNGGTTNTSPAGQRFVITNGILRLGANITISNLVSSGSPNYDLGGPETGASPGSNTALGENGQLWNDGATIQASGNALVVYGTYRQTAGSITCANEGLVVRGTGSVIIEGGVVNAEKFRPSTIGASTPRGSFRLHGGTVNINDSFPGSSNNGYARFCMPYLDQVFIMTGGTLNIADPETGGTAINGLIDIRCLPSNISVTGGTINVTIPASTTNAHISSTAPFPNFNVNKAAGTGTSTAQLVLQQIGVAASGSGVGATTARPLTVLGDFTIQTGNSPLFNANNQDVTIGGTLNVQSGTTFRTGTNTVTFIGDGSDFITINGTLEVNQNSPGFNNLTVNRTAGTLFASQSFFVRGTLTLLGSAPLNDNGFNIDVIGNVVNSGVHQSAGSGSLRLVGTATQTIGGNGSGQFGNLTLNNAQNPGATLTANQTINGTLTLESSTCIFNIDIYRLRINNGNTDAIQPTGGFSATRYIRVTANPTSPGVERYITGTGTYLFPIGEVDGSTDKYTPAEVYITITTLTGNGYIAINPVDQVLATTNSAGGPDILSYYWRVRRSGFNNAPTVSMRFTYDNADIGGTEANYVPGRVLDQSPFTRSTDGGTDDVDDATNQAVFNGSSTGATFPGAGFDLDVDANYTAGAAGRFTGTPTVYRSFGATSHSYDANVAPQWNATSSWTLGTSHTTGQIVPSQPPGAGDIVIIGPPAPNTGIFHHIVVPNGYNAQCAELRFNSPTDDPEINFGPRLTVRENGTANVTAVKNDITGTGGTVMLFFNNTQFASFTGDLTGWSDGTGIVMYQMQANNTAGRLFPTGLPTVYPNVRFEGGRGGTANRIMILPNENWTVKQNCFIDEQATVRLNDDTNGNLTIGKDLRLGRPSNDQAGRLQFPGTSTNIRTLTIGRDLLFGGETTSGGSNGLVMQPGTTTDVEHRLRVGRNIERIGATANAAELDLFTSATGPRAVLELFSSQNGVYNKGGNNADLWRIEMNKGTDTTATFSVNLANITASGATTLNGGSTKFLTLLNGRFILNAPLTLNLTSGGDPFQIPSTAGLILQSGTATVTGTNTGILLDGLLRIDGGTLNAGNGTTTDTRYIEFGSSGNARLQLWSGTVRVNSQIRRSPFATAGVLKYVQHGGLLIIYGRGALASRAKFDVPENAGSEFTMTGGTITLVRGGGTTYGDLYLRPPTASVTGGTIVLNSTGAGNQTFDIDCNIALNALTITGSAGNDATGRLRINPLTLTNSLTLSGTLTISNNNSIFDANGLDVFIGGDLINNNYSTTPGLNVGGYQPQTATQTTTFNRADEQRINSTAPVLGNLTNFANLVLTGGSGTLTLNRNIRVNSNLTINAGKTLNDNGNTATVIGNITHNGTHTGTGSITLAGSVQQQLFGTGTYQNLTLNNSAGAKTNANTTVAGVLTLTNGILDIGSNLLSLTNTGAAVSGTFSNTRMIRTNGNNADQGVQKSYPAGASNFLFPIGTGTRYTPARLNVTATGAEGTIRVVPVNNVHPGVEFGANVLRYYWIVRSTGFSNPTVQHSYNAPGDGGDQNLPVTGTPDRVGRLNPDAVPAPNWDPIGGFAPGSDWTYTNTNRSITSVGVNYINGDYTAGTSAEFSSIPVYTSIASGNWENQATWTTTPPTFTPPRSGSNVIINNGHTVTTQPNAIISVTVNNGGSGYAVGDVLNVVQPGGTGGQVTVTNVDAFGAIIGTPPGISLTNGGTGYTTATGVTTSGGQGSNATVNIVASLGKVGNSVTINSGGTLDLGNTIGHNFSTIAGQGTLRLTPTSGGSYVFPGGSATGFLSSGGGTVEYSGSTNGDLPPAPTSYNNIRFSNSAGSTASYPNVDLTLAGNLTVDGGGTVSNPDNRNITVGGDFNISGGSTYNAGNGTLSIGGNFTGSGSYTFNANGATMPITGRFTNTGTFNANTSTITISGADGGGSNYSFANTGTFNAGTGTVIFGGGSAQTLGGSLTTFNNLTINKSSNNLTLAGTTNQQVNGTLTLTNGNIITGSNALILGSTSAVAGGGNSSYVEGNIGGIYTTTNALRTYPFGSSGLYRRIGVRGNTSTGTATLLGSLINGSAYSVTSALSGLTNVSTIRYYQFQNSGQALTVTQIENFRGNTDDNIGSFASNNTLRIGTAVSDASPVWTGRTLLSVPNTTTLPIDISTQPFSQSVAASGSGSIFYATLASTSLSDNPLPVELMSFAITAVDEGVKLKWETASEVDNAGFIVSRSRFRDSGFEELASYRTHDALVGKGTSTTGGKYEWIDKSKLLPGETYYYKLEDVDFNGVIHTTEIKEFVMPKEYSLSQNYPNPFNSSTVIEFNLRMPGRTVLEVYNVLGQRVMTVVDGELSAGSYRYQVNMTGMASGMYLYRLRSRDFVATKKMLLIK